MKKPLFLVIGLAGAGLSIIGLSRSRKRVSNEDRNSDVLNASRPDISQEQFYETKWHSICWNSHDGGKAQLDIAIREFNGDRVAALRHVIEVRERENNRWK